ncbi:DUF1120 domain-containing protein [Achromobacter spanius]|uniref:DUF1120 domain-containing protein n=1 Tax=Achromobacter spanius TaxID=217203 RepID=UPI002227B7D0|nr:DUF1120 domain-containing protein [Achromobacter spanius]MCW3156048.1 DUF1120 domain-containing protein [Achromobacter spanius]
MTKTLPRLYVGLALAAASTTHAATNQADLVIGGQLTPPACSMGFGGASPVDFGTLPFHSLNRNGTLLPEQRPRLEIACGGPTRVSFTVHENRPDTAITHQAAIASGMPWPYQNPLNGTPHAWGLGRIDDVKIGAVVLLVRPHATVVDGVPPFQSTSMVLSRPRGSASWPVQSAIDTINVNPADEYSFGKDATAMPITTVSVSLAVTPVLNGTTALPTSKEIPLDGSVTFTLRYL